MRKRQPDPSMHSGHSLTALRRTLIMAMWLDYKLFGYTTETVIGLQKRIVREKQGGKVIQFPVNRKARRAA